MKAFLKRISSRKFLTALAVQVAAVVALFTPADDAGQLEAAAVKIAALAAMVLTAFGYGLIEGSVDKANLNGGNTD